MLMVIGLSVVFTSCDDGYGPGPGPGGLTYIDRDLTGAWRMYEANGVPVPPGKVDYLQFNGNGNGRYYYMRDGIWYYEGISYWCKSYGSGTDQLNIQYENGQSSAMSYWFTSRDDLYLSWRVYDGSVITYHYIYTSYLP